MEITNGVVVEDIFPYTKEVLANFKAEQNALQHEYEELELELAATKEKITVNVLDREAAKLSERIYLTAQHKELTSKIDIIIVMLEENKEKQTALKIHYAGLLRDSIRREAAIRGKYSANEIVNHYRYLMLSDIANIGKQMQSQYRELAPDIWEILDEPFVKEQYPRFVSPLDFSDRFRPSFWEANTTLLRKEHVLTALSGAIHSDIPRPKEVENQ